MPKKSKFPVLVERRLKMKSPESDTAKDVVVQIGHPRTVGPQGDADCPVAVKGLYDDLPDIRGIDSLDALRLAINFVERLLRDKKTEVKLYWPDGEEYVPSEGTEGR
jgi:hypothetical protein